MDPLFERRELTRKIHIHSKFLQRNIEPSLLAQLKMNYEGRCSSEGYVQPQSITILQWHVGRTNYVKGGVDYDVRFQADLCFPHQGQVFKATVAIRSKIGIEARTPPIKVLIPRDLHIGNPDFEKAEIGQEIEFEVVGSQFNQQDKDIIVVGRLRSALKPAPLMPLLTAETEITVPTFTPSQQPSEEKTVLVTQTEPEKKKTRKLKKPNVSIPNESGEAGMVEGSIS